MKWFWGLLIVSFGLVFLGQSIGLLNYDQFNQLSQFWPLILILFGIALIVRHLNYGWMIILVSFILCFIFMYFSLSFKIIDDYNIRSNQKAETNYFSENLPSEVKKAKIIINTGAVNLKITSSSDKLIDGKLVSKFSVPELEKSISQDEITIRIKNTKISGGFWGKSDFNIAITDKIPVELDINSGASNINLDLENIILSNLNLNTGASSMDIKIGQTEEASIEVNTGASSLNILLPKDLGVKVIAKTGLTSKNFEDFIQKDNNTYQTSNYDEALNKLNFSISSGASSITIKQY